MTRAAHEAGVAIIPYRNDPLLQLSQDLIARNREALPDLSHVTVLVSEPQVAAPLRQRLLDAVAEQGKAGLVGLEIVSLRDWVRQFLPDSIRICPPISAELILVEALLPHQHLFNQANPWLLAGEMLELFEALTLSEIGLPQDLDTFITQLQSAYGLRQNIRQALSREATVIHSLWHAWHQQIQAHGLTDSHSAYLLALHNSLQQTDAAQQIWLAGYQQFYPAEQQWLEALLQRQQLTLYLHGQASEVEPGYPEQHLQPLIEQLDLSSKLPDPGDRYSAFLDIVFGEQTVPLQQTAQQLGQLPGPVQERLSVLLADSAEQEARAIDIQVRQWLLQGKQQVAIVTENRRLARRIRALLERADVQLADAAGWALSTTSAAAALERWLECIEEDFAHLPLLDLLKSPFVFQHLDAEQVQHATYRLEQDIIRHENIARNLNRYRAHIHDRRKRLPDWLPDDNTLLSLLDALEQAAAPLLPLRRGRHPAASFVTQLKQSLQLLGMHDAFNLDAAGSRLLQLLEQLDGAARPGPFQLKWADFRIWLGRHLESFNFRPRPTQQTVQLMGLAQSQLQQFDALVIASAEQEHLPGHPSISPFFNDQVRRELGLKSQDAHYAERFYHIRRLLEAAPVILITAREEQDGEPVVISPWLEYLLTLHHQTYRQDLLATALHRLVQTDAAEVIRCDSRELPEPQQQPRPAIRAALIPDKFSPSDYQQLLNCPYQYYAARCLQLSPPEEISEALSKADYGQRIHLCLQAFHGQVRGLPGPFRQSFIPANRDAAMALLQEISAAVFADVLPDNFEHQAWLSQWQAYIPVYIDWQIARAAEWQVAQVETQAEVSLNDIRLKGRLDRIDSAEAGRAIIDYKTGFVPKQDEVINGEFIQLPFYALLDQQQHPEARVEQVGYLKFESPDKVTVPYLLEHDDLQQLAAAIAGRLLEIVTQMKNQTGVPAWGDSRTCEHCDMGLLCRKQVWQA